MQDYLQPVAKRRRVAREANEEEQVKDAEDEETEDDGVAKNSNKVKKKAAKKANKKKVDMTDEEKAAARMKREDGRGWKGRRDTLEDVDKLEEFIAKHAKQVTRYIEAIYVWYIFRQVMSQ